MKKSKVKSLFIKSLIMFLLLELAMAKYDTGNMCSHEAFNYGLLILRVHYNEPYYRATVRGTVRGAV